MIWVKNPVIDVKEIYLPIIFYSIDSSNMEKVNYDYLERAVYILDEVIQVLT